MVMTTLPAEGNTAWYGHYTDLHDNATAGPGGALIVAASDAPAAVQTAAHYVCDGTADQVQINDAITAASTTGTRRGLVILSGGTFTCNGSVLMRTGVWLRGCGVLSEVKSDGLTASTGSGANPALVKLNDANVHLTTISDLWLNGNYAAGGSGSHGIYYDGAGGGSLGGTPDSDPDSDNTIARLYISQFTNAGTRHGVYVADTDHRGTQISDLNIRGISGHAVYSNSSPDSHINNVHIGTVDGSGIRIEGGNWKVTNCKAYYCDAWGFYLSGSRMVASCNESQDNANGVYAGGQNCHLGNFIIDTSDVTSLEVAGDLTQVAATIFHRSSGRYANGTTAVVFSGSPTNTIVDAVVNTTDIGTVTSGTYTAASNRITISHGSTLIQHP